MFGSALRCDRPKYPRSTSPFGAPLYACHPRIMNRYVASRPIALRATVALSPGQDLGVLPDAEYPRVRALLTVGRLADRLSAPSTIRRDEERGMAMAHFPSITPLKVWGA